MVVVVGACEGETGGNDSCHTAIGCALVFGTTNGNRAFGICDINAARGHTFGKSECREFAFAESSRPNAQQKNTKSRKWSLAIRISARIPMSMGRTRVHVAGRTCYLWYSLKIPETVGYLGVLPLFHTFVI